MLLQNCSAVFRSNQHTTFGDEVNGWFNRRAAIEVNRSLTVDKTQTNGFFFKRIARIARVQHCRRTSNTRTTHGELDSNCMSLIRGLATATQKRALLLHLAAPLVWDIFSNSIPADVRGGAKDYDKGMDSSSEHFKLRKNTPMARQFYYSPAVTRRALWLRRRTG